MARKPFRSRPLGCLLMTLASLAFGSILMVDWRRNGTPSNVTIALLVISLLFVSPAVFILGASLMRRDASGILADPRLRPILYLRPFAQEDVSSPGNVPWNAFVERYRLHPMNVVLGLGFALPFLNIMAFGLQQLGGWWMSLGMAIPLFVLAIALSMCLYGACYCLRMMRGRVNVTFEQELCHHLKHIGPIVAIGEPGEWFAPAGGARVYLDDDSWQAVVNDAIQRARVIVVHLVPEGWTWWECCQALKSEDPTRVLALVVGRFYTDDSYLRLRERMQRELGVTLRERRGDYELISFDADLTPRYLPLKYRPWPLYPFVSYRLSRSTFEPFVSRLGNS